MSVSRISAVLPEPKFCDNCGSDDIAFVKSTVQTNEWPWNHFCNTCRASVGCHNKTRVPMGRMADRTTRMLRAKAHDAFDRLWVNHVMSRDAAYSWLAEMLKIPSDECHLAWLTKAQLIDTIEISTNNYKELEKIYARREKRRIRKQFKRIEREHKRNGNRNINPKFFE